jgi:hypothetical protein
MAGQYSHKQFFRHVPHLQLADYFKSKEVDLGIDFKELKGKDVDGLFDAFTGLSPELQATIEAEFQDVNAMACEGGVAAFS